jgi:RNA polymerase sigma-70 factor (ECF subfamily)
LCSDDDLRQKPTDMAIEAQARVGGSSSDARTEEKFIAALAAGDPVAAEEAWNRYAPMIHDLFRRGLGPRAELEDAVQEAFLRVFRRIGTLRDPAMLRSFVFSIGVNVLRWQLRRRVIRRIVGLSLDGALPEPVGQPADMDAREALRRFYALLDKLGPLDRTIFILRHAHEMSLPEIARVTGSSLSTVKRRLGRVAPRLARLAQADSILSTYLSPNGWHVDDAASPGGDDVG